MQHSSLSKVGRKSHPYISDLGESLSARAVLDGLDGHGDLHCLSLWDPEPL